MNDRPTVASEDQLAEARRILEDTRDRIHYRHGAPTVSVLAHMLHVMLDCPLFHVQELLEAVGIDEPLKGSLTRRRIELFLGLYRDHPLPALAASGSELKLPRWASASQLAAVRKLLDAQRRVVRQERDQLLSAWELGERIAKLMDWKFQDAQTLLKGVGIVEPVKSTLTQTRIGEFIRDAGNHAVRYQPPLEVKSHQEKQQARKKRHRQKEKHGQAPEQVRKQPAHPPAPMPQRETPKQQAERLLKEREQQLRDRLQRSTARTTARPRPITASVNTVRRPSANLTACSRLVHGNATGTPARLTADLYLGIAELTAYGATDGERAAARIAAERFGIHAESDAAVRMHARARQAFERQAGGEMLDHLSRFARRPRGLFYDGYKDRLTLWETEDESMVLYTCTVAEVRTAATTALELGDLGLPRLTRRVVSQHTEPAGVDDPALVLAATAEQLGRQAELARRRPQPDAHPDEKALLPCAPGSGKQPLRDPEQAPLRPGVTWVVPVAGTHENLQVGRMDASYTHHVAGPRSRAATTVREHMRRPAGSSPYAQPTIKVRSHPRRGT